MPYYPDEVSGRFLGPGFAGKACGANAVGTSASFECGCFVRISMTIHPELKLIQEAMHLTNGCGYMAAAADAAAEMLTGRALTEMHSAGVDDLVSGIEAVVGTYPSERRQCARVAVEAAIAAFGDFRAFLIDEYTGDKPLICTCFGVSEETIENFINSAPSSSVDAVTDACRAGGGCGSCRMLIQEMIDQQEYWSGNP